MPLIVIVIIIIIINIIMTVKIRIRIAFNIVNLHISNNYIYNVAT